MSIGRRVLDILKTDAKTMWRQRQCPLRKEKCSPKNEGLGSDLLSQHILHCIIKAEVCDDQEDGVSLNCCFDDALRSMSQGCGDGGASKCELQNTKSIRSDHTRC